MAPKPAAHALHTLARTGDAEGVAAALAADPDCVTAVGSLQRTALHLAAWAGDAQALCACFLRRRRTYMQEPATTCSPSTLGVGCEFRIY